MSKATEEALREAIIAHARDNSDPDEASVPADWFLGDWAIATQWLNPSEDGEGTASYMRIMPSEQFYHRTLGLFHNALEDGMLRQVRQIVSE